MTSPSIQIKTFTLGPWMTNCYLLLPPSNAASTAPSSDESSSDAPNDVIYSNSPSDCWIIDAGYDPHPMIDFLLHHHLRPQYVILTHAHLDHIAGIYDLRKHWPKIKILIHPEEKEFLADPALNLSQWGGQPITAPPADQFLAHGQQFSFHHNPIHIRHTPGHSPGGISLYLPLQQTAIVGDTLFADSIGRYDFPTSDGPTLLHSIKTQLLTLPPVTKIFPGHGPATTIAREQNSNPYLA